ncbi:hypothetical protein MY10362_002261, partial [Beauveria mimosiformis]
MVNDDVTLADLWQYGSSIDGAGEELCMVTMVQKLCYVSALY